MPDTSTDLIITAEDEPEIPLDSNPPWRPSRFVVVIVTVVAIIGAYLVGRSSVDTHHSHAAVYVAKRPAAIDYSGVTRARDDRLTFNMITAMNDTIARKQTVKDKVAYITTVSSQYLYRALNLSPDPYDRVIVAAEAEFILTNLVHQYRYLQPNDATLKVLSQRVIALSPPYFRQQLADDKITNPMSDYIAPIDNHYDPDK